MSGNVPHCINLIEQELERYLQIPVLIEVMPSPSYWYSDGFVGAGPLLLDISHINIWCEGDSEKVRAHFDDLLPRAKGVHLSHNNGRMDSHDLIPDGIWFEDLVTSWAESHFVTYESLPSRWAEYERRDKRREISHRALALREARASGGGFNLAPCG